MRFARRIAMGDPQAPFAQVLAVLDAHGLRGDDGRLAPDVQLVSVGDHFDWGTPAQRRLAAQDAVKLLAWLTSHPPEQVVLIAGNHDVSRIGELSAFDGTRFDEAQAEADHIYDRDSGQTDREAQRAFLARYPDVPSAEVIARDFASFESHQRDRVRELLRRGRWRLAYAASHDVLLTHAGVTSEDLSAAGLPASLHHDAFAAAEALNRAFDRNRTFDEWGGVTIPGLHLPGRARNGEGRGILYHRPAHPGYGDSALFERPWARRFDPRRLPIGLTQVIGHIQDRKCRTLLRGWADAARPRHGVIRYMQTDDAAVTYRHGVPQQTTVRTATMLFIDGGMQHIAAEKYELLDLNTRRPVVRPA